MERDYFGEGRGEWFDIVCNRSMSIYCGEEEAEDSSVGFEGVGWGVLM